MYRYAEFSDCGQYRWVLKREWIEHKDSLCFIGLNPSTANATTDDATIRRVIRFAARENYGGVIMLNLFALVSTDPRLLLTHPSAVGAKADEFLRRETEGRNVVFCWGAFPEAQKRAAEVIEMFPKALCLGKTKAGHPKHPLYLAGDTPLVQFADGPLL